MMLTPCCPRDGPTGGEGVACPAGTCNFTFATTCFAMLYSARLRRRHLLNWLDLQELQLNRSGTSKNTHHHFELATFRINLFDHSCKVGKRSINHTHIFPKLKENLWSWFCCLTAHVFLDL